ncbi:hypothetical protein M316_0126 [Nitrincola phage 1M3-16]|uniref:hypothetical protein n=1 Tax=Nitrincola phage 1M3-16 TaxID=1472912 RepID=UPI000444EAD4|nr:hypothetical protein GJ22_gp026 [Nitrincola phage 1M3-16]AHX01191.1 hypothetical protein M316_0126 [Nitrincola phage 1M3-16]
MANVKSVQLSKDGINFREIPGSSAEISSDSASTDDSVFGTTFSSSQPTLITWTMSSNGYYKGFPGYKATLKRTGTSTALASPAATTVDANDPLKFYITNRAQSLLDNTVDVDVYDDGVIVDSADIEYIDYLQGAVKFVSGYVVEGPITIDGNYLPLAAICQAQNFTLGQSADTENVTDFCTAQANNGYAVFSYQQQNAELSLDGFYSDASGFFADLLSRDQVIIEINPDGEGKSVARGYFRASSHSQSGDVGSTETESITYALAVPEGVRFPFSWYHASDSSIPEAVLWALEAWVERAPLYVRYRAENSTVRKSGQVLVSDVSLTSGIEAVADFALDFQGTGAITETSV